MPGIPGLCGVGYVCLVTSTGPGCEPTPLEETLLVQISDPSFYPPPTTDMPPSPAYSIHFCSRHIHSVLQLLEHLDMVVEKASMSLNTHPFITVISGLYLPASVHVC